VQRHLKELNAVPTYVLCLELIKDEDSLEVLEGEPSTGATHDARLVKIAQEVAASHNWPVAVGKLPRPHGTDAAPFSLSGIPATCLASTRLGFNDPTYHTWYDTDERIQPRSLSIMLQLVIDMIRRIDNA
jgi:aminopeptidase-like protein